MRLVAAPWLVLLATSWTGCTAGERGLFGECPTDEDCSDTTPRGLHFFGAGLGGVALDLGNHPTAVGGTQTIRLALESSGGNFRPLDLPYTADDDGGAGVVVEATAGANVTLRGVATAENYLRILDATDGTLMDRKRMEGAAITQLALVPRDPESVEGEPVFVTGPQQVTVALSGEVDGSSGPYTTRVVDESMTIELAGAVRTRWDTVELADATAGVHDLVVTAGDRAAETLVLEVVTAPEQLVARPLAEPLAVGQLAALCFSALHTGRYVAGLTWTIALDNGTPTSFVRNCVLVQPEREGTLTATVTAGPLSLTESYAVGPAPARARTVDVPARATTGGERAAATL